MYKISLRITIFLILLFFFCSEKTNAQYGTIRGFVYETETGEPIIFTNVYIYKTTMGAATDINGYFAITKIPPGQYTLMVSYMGFDTLRFPVTIKANDLITKKLFMTKSTFYLGEVNIYGSRS